MGFPSRHGHRRHPDQRGRVCVFAETPRRRFADAVRRDLAATLRRVLAETTPSVADRVAAGRQVEPVRAFPGMPGRLRRPWGPGWALVGDAGYFRDPITAHGITDALIDAELLARALDRVLAGTDDPTRALAGYERVRDDLAIPLFDITDAVAGFAWTLDEVQQLHLKMSDAMQAEVDVLAALDSHPTDRVAA